MEAIEFEGTIARICDIFVLFKLTILARDPRIAPISIDII
jgi:hypothetical protein